MKILLPVYIGGHGGASRQVVMLANHLASKGHEVSLVALHVFNPFFTIDKSIKIINLVDVECGAKFPLLSRFWAYRKVLRNEKPDITIHYNYQSAYFTALSCVKHRGKAVYAERGDPSDVTDYPFALRIIRYIANIFIDGFVFQTKGAQGFFNKKIQERSVVIPNSVAVREGLYDKVDKREKKIVSSGRLHPQKNQALLINAFSKIADKYRKYKLEIYGEGDLRKELTQLINQLDLGKQVELKGVVKNIFEVTRSASLFVLSSDFEGMPNALMEAMALGVPCISTDCSPGGARDLIEEGVNGWITPIRDVDALAQRMDYVLSHPDVAEQVATRAMAISSTHTDERVFSLWDEFLLRMMN